jgi:hypothetical protein
MGTEGSHSRIADDSALKLALVNIEYNALYLFKIQDESTYMHEFSKISENNVSSVQEETSSII